MNVFILREALTLRYNSHLKELRNKITNRSRSGQVCSYFNHLSSRPVGQTMQKTLRQKLQNAINNASIANTGCPALFVGGRRCNRKRRRNKNGQKKRKNRETVETDRSLRITSITPDFLYCDFKQTKQTVQCLDIEESVLIEDNAEIPTESHKANENCMDTVNVNNSVQVSSVSEHGIDFENEIAKSDNLYIYDLEQKVAQDLDYSIGQRVSKISFPRTRSKDSGVYDDDDDDDCIDNDSAYNENDCEDDNETSETENHSNTNNDGLSFAKTDKSIQDEFDEIDLKNDGQEMDTERQADKHEQNTNADVDRVMDLKDIPNVDRFLQLEADDEEEIIFDLSQLEMNTNGGISKFKKRSADLQEGLNYEPTELEDEVTIFRVPMDLLIEDEQDDEVLFDARPRRELNITCNPLFDQSLKDEENASIKSYQSGFRTNFESVNFIQIPTTTSNKSRVNPRKESSSLLKNRGGDDQFACCVIL